MSEVHVLFLPFLCPKREPGIQRREPWSSVHRLPTVRPRQDSLHTLVSSSVILPRDAVRNKGESTEDSAWFMAEDSLAWVLIGWGCVGESSPLGHAVLHRAPWSWGTCLCCTGVGASLTPQAELWLRGASPSPSGKPLCVACYIPAETESRNAGLGTTFPGV